MTIWYKQGVYGNLTDETAEGLRLVERFYHSKRDLVYVTSKRDGSHMAGSFHPHGRAFDIKKGVVKLSELKAALCGKGFDVVEHSTHYHIEYDPH